MTTLSALAAIALLTAVLALVFGAVRHAYDRQHVEDHGHG